MAHAGGGPPAGGAAAAPGLVALQPAQLQALADMLRAGGPGATRLRRMTEATPGAWMEHRRHFAKVVELQNWNDLRQRRELLASIQEKAGNAIIDIDVAAFVDIDALLTAVEARFMPAAAGSTARSNYNSARQLPTESVREWHTRLRELFNLAYPNQNPNDHAHCLDLFVQGLANANVKFFVGSQDIPDFHTALTMAERSETASKRSTSSAGNVHALTDQINAMDFNGRPRQALACYFCSDMFAVSNPHTKSNCPYWKAAQSLFLSENGRPQQSAPSQAAAPSGRQANHRKGNKHFKRKPKRSVNAVQAPPPAAALLADSSDEEAGN